MLTQPAASRGKQQINCHIRLFRVETLLSVKRFVTLSTCISVKFSIYVVLCSVFQLLRCNLYVTVASGIKGWGRRGQLPPGAAGKEAQNSLTKNIL